MSTVPNIQASCLLASKNPYNKAEVFTFVVHTPKFINAEWLTHSNLTVNASSSRAIGFPITKLQGGKPYIPTTLQTPSKSMHGTETVSEAVRQAFTNDIEELFKHSVDVLEKYKDDIHKQHLNRYIEAFTVQTLVITGNKYAWDNFLKLRLSEFADTNIQEVANKISKIMDTTIPIVREYHIPMLAADDWFKLDSDVHQLSMLSAGRIARISYDNLHKLEDIDTSIKRAVMLREHEHKSVFTHQLFADNDVYSEGITHIGVVDGELSGCDYYSGSIYNWVQYRKLIWNSLQEK